MPKRKPSRSQRRGRRQTAAPERPAPAPPAATRAVARPIPVAAQAGEAPKAAQERSVTRLATRDYSYVRREINRILILAAIVLVTLVVLSFFLP